MNIKNLMIQYGDCKNNCSFCYLKKQKIIKDKNKFFNTLDDIYKNHKIENLYISYQNLQYKECYEFIIYKFINSIVHITINNSDYVKNYWFIDNEIFKKRKILITKSINDVSEYSYINKNSFFYNDERYELLKHLLENKKQLSFNKIYISIDKFSKINLLKLFELYTEYPDLIDLDSCYKRVLNNKTCNDIFVLNEDGNIYTCPYTTQFKDNNFENISKKCPYINLGVTNDNKK